MKHDKIVIAVIGISALLLGIGNARASIAYGTLNNFDCVNDTGVEAHGFDIEMDDIQSKDTTYTYDYNHYGVPRITEDITTVPGHTNVLIRYSGVRTNGGWSAYTAVPSGPISPTQGHQFTDPTVNFGGEHFGVAYYGAPSAVKYNWLIDDGTGNLIHGPPVNVSTPSFTYNPPVGAAPANVVAVIEPPPPPAPRALRFGDASWVKSIKTTTHNTNKVELVELVAEDEGQPQPWANGEPAEVEVEWKLLQRELANAANPKGVLQGEAEDLPGGKEVITRRYEFYKYTGPIDAETGEAVAEEVAADGTNGVGIVTYASHVDPNTGEWVDVTVDLSTNRVVGDFFGAQMSGFDVAPNLGLIDHLQDGEIHVPYPDRTVVVAGGAPFLAGLGTGSLPNGMRLDPVSGVLSGTPTVAGEFIFTVEASDTSGAVVSKTYTNTIAPGAAPGSNTVAISASPALGGTTSGDGDYANGMDVTVTATANEGFAFVNWTEGGVVVSVSANYTFTLNANRTLVASFVPTYRIMTSVSPEGGGTTGGDGIYYTGLPVTVTATTNAGFAFVKWTEGGMAVSASAIYTFSASTNRTLVANFVPVYTITTSSSPSAGGSTSPGGTVNGGDSFTVIAAANAGYSFVDWTAGGTVVSFSATFTFTPTTNLDLVANFVPSGTFAITTSASPVAGGTTSGGGTVNSGSNVTVVATANAGYIFANWTEGGAVVSTSASYTFTASANRTLVANFVQASTFTIATSASPSAGGSTSGGGIYNSGGSVTVVATANAGYNFVNWTEGGANVSASASYTFTASANHTLVANFAQAGTFTIATSASPAAGGSTSGGGIYNSGGIVSVVASANAGYNFVNWTEGGAVVSTLANYTFTASANRTLVANFVQAGTFTITISASPSAGGSTSGGGIYNSGGNVTVVATANAGYNFVNWTEGGAVVSTLANYTFTASANRTLVANFVQAGTFTITISASPSAGGSTSGGGIYNSGGSVTVIATANAGYNFVNWTEGGAVVSTSASFTFAASANRTLVANFVQAGSFTITTSASPSAGGSTSGGGIYNSGGSVTVVASANAGYNFVNWTEGGAVVSTSASYTFTASANRTLVANFAQAGTFTITIGASPSAGGSTSGGGIYNSGGSVTVVASANAGYNFVNWTEGGAVVSTSASYTFIASANRTLVANFVASGTFTIATSASPSAGGSTSGGGIYNSGGNVTVVATANAGYNFVNWTEGGAVVSTSASYTFIASANRTLVANFVQSSTFTIATSASPSAGGSTSGGGTYNTGGSVTVVATANAGYNFVNWTEGGAVVSTSASYTFIASANRTLVANFVPTTHGLEISSATATYNRGKVYVTVTIRNNGDSVFQAVTIGAKKETTLDGKASHENRPIVLGNIAPGGTETAILTFTGVKAGTRTLKVTLTYKGGTAILSIPVEVLGNGQGRHGPPVHTGGGGGKRG